ncbi:hypothetical protein [Tissierella praeacuta]|uniref:hypothetical protein n=1 Tax=Tissierella praeacuta TaxID=43131 RepID=UPI00334104F3
MADMENILQQILENQLFMQNQFNNMQNQFNNMQNQINTMDNKIDNNHKQVMDRLDNVEKGLLTLENNQSAIKEFILQSDSSFRKSEETYKVIQDIRNIFAKED